MNFLASLRQWIFFPREIRIAPSIQPQTLLAEFDKLAQLLRPQEGLPSADISPTALKEQQRFLADVGTGLWRLRQKMVQPGSDKPLEEMRRAYRHLESTWDALTQAGVEIHDHTGETVPEGGIYALKTIAFQPTPGVSHEKVVETIKPTIYYKDQMIQMGEVIIATKETSDAKTEKKD